MEWSQHCSCPSRNENKHGKPSYFQSSFWHTLDFNINLQLRYMQPRSSYLVADGADVVVLLQLCVAGCGEALDLVDSVPPEQEALPAQLGSEPDVIVGVNQDDCASHYTPLPKDGLWHTVAHHTHGDLPHKGSKSITNLGLYDLCSLGVSAVRDQWYDMFDVHVHHSPGTLAICTCH